MHEGQAFPSPLYIELPQLIGLSNCFNNNNNNNNDELTIKNCEKYTMKYRIRLKVHLRKNLMENQCIILNILILK